jgi:hypothetical protein
VPEPAAAQIFIHGDAALGQHEKLAGVVSFVIDL